MKAVLCTKYGPPGVLKVGSFRDPVPKDDEILIGIKSASVTNSDIFIRGADIPLYMRIPMKIMLGITKPRQKIIGEVLSALPSSSFGRASGSIGQPRLLDCDLVQG